MKLWTCWLRAEDGATWLEGAMDDESTAENHAAWESIVRDAERIAHENAGYQCRIVAIDVPYAGIFDAFKIAETTGEVVDA